ncbi:MAG: hydroxypyruvate isomerase [Actinomycetota bacterium]|nr:hydroxypyruvate isomerase [Actinomycetota bacterium]
MPRFAANLSFMFAEEESLLDRFAAARGAGFSAVEYMFPYEEEPDAIRARLDENELEQVLFNLPAGDWSAGDRGTACDPDRVDEFRDGVERAREYARALECERINCLAGLRLDDRSYEEQWEVLVENVRHAAEALAEDGRTLLVEPVNSYDVEGFLIPYTADVMRLLDEVDAPNLRLQYDFYHAQKMEGNLCERFDELLDRIGHVQVADNPGRHQPGTGEIDYAFVFEHIDGSGYDGWVGLEYAPDGDTRSSLAWVDSYGLKL